MQENGQRGDRDDEDQIEEELQPGRPPLSSLADT